jgi:hypothetical protein
MRISLSCMPVHMQVPAECVVSAHGLQMSGASIEHDTRLRLHIRLHRTSKPEMTPASLVAWRCESLKYAGTVITADLTFFDSPRYLQAALHTMLNHVAVCSSTCPIIAAHPDRQLVQLETE